MVSWSGKERIQRHVVSFNSSTQTYLLTLWKRAELSDICVRGSFLIQNVFCIGCSRTLQTVTRHGSDVPPLDLSTLLNSECKNLPVQYQYRYQDNHYGLHMQRALHALRAEINRKITYNQPITITLLQDILKCYQKDKESTISGLADGPCLLNIASTNTSSLLRNPISIQKCYLDVGLVDNLNAMFPNMLNQAAASPLSSSIHCSIIALPSLNIHKFIQETAEFRMPILGGQTQTNNLAQC